MANEFVDMLVEHEWSKTDAEAKIQQLTANIKKNFPEGDQAFVDATIKAALAKLLKSKIEQIPDALCVGFSRKQDSNSFSKRKAKEIYAQNPQKAVQDKYVVVDDANKVVFEVDPKTKERILDPVTKEPIPVAADNREFVDQAGKMKNSRWGKALGEKIQRDAYFIVGGKFVRAFGNFDVKMGYMYTIYGSMSAKGYITVPEQGPGVRGGVMLDDVAYWDAVNKVAQADDLAVSLGDTKDVLKNKPLVTKGFVTTVRQAGTRVMVVLNDDTMPEGMVCFTDDEAMNKEAELLGSGNEIIVIGRMSENEDKVTHELRRSISMLGFASNPESDKIASAVRGLDSVLYE